MKVLIIYSPNSFTKQSIIDQIVSEGHKHEFLFMVDLADEEVIGRLREASEVWVYGQVHDDVNLHLARSSGVEIWQMS
jgi:hypothetical protein